MRPVALLAILVVPACGPAPRPLDTKRIELIADHYPGIPGHAMEHRLELTEGGPCRVIVSEWPVTESRARGSEFEFALPPETFGKVRDLLREVEFFRMQSAGEMKFEESTLGVRVKTDHAEHAVSFVGAPEEFMRLYRFATELSERGQKVGGRLAQPLPGPKLP
jgi:hypothetical protein